MLTGTALMNELVDELNELIGVDAYAGLSINLCIIKNTFQYNKKIKGQKHVPLKYLRNKKELSVFFTLLVSNCA